MAKKKKDTRMGGSYVKKQCKLCKQVVNRVDSSADSVICWECTQLHVRGYDRSEISNITAEERSKIFVK